MKQKRHIPLRTCCACRAKKPKLELIRIVRIAPDQFKLDLNQKMLGRGAYVCPEMNCVYLLKKKKGLKKEKGKKKKGKFFSKLFGSK